MTTIEAGVPASDVGPPRWVAASLEVKEGRDPLGLQTTTTDRLMPRLLPGILELSRRARYLSFHAYLLDLYREQRRHADGNALSAFVKAREWEYGLAVLNCPHHCGSVPVGADRIRPVLSRHGPPYPRGESVESPFGGYGLYYRSPLAELGIVARAGTLLGETPTTVDVLYDTERARQLARTFRAAVSDTEYVSVWMPTSDPIPLDVLVEYANVGCLCQLRLRSDERAAVHEALFGSDQTGDADPPAPEDSSDAAADGEGSFAILGQASSNGSSAVTQRRRSVAHYLSLVAANPTVVREESAYREAMWSPPTARSPEHALVAGQWAGLMAKDVWQDCLCSIWSEFCREGLAATLVRHGDGLPWDAVEELARNLVNGPPALSPELPTADLASCIGAGDVALPGIEEAIPDVPLEALRRATVTVDSATSGLIVALASIFRAIEA